MPFLTQSIVLNFVLTALIIHADGRFTSMEEEVNTQQYQNGDDNKDYAPYFHSNEDQNIEHLQNEDNIDATHRCVVDSRIGNQEHNTDLPGDQKSGKVYSSPTCGIAICTRHLNDDNLCNTNAYQVPITSGNNEKDIQNARLFKELLKAQLQYYSLVPGSSTRKPRFTAENNDKFTAIPESITSDRALDNSVNSPHQSLQQKVNPQRENISNDPGGVENNVYRDGHVIASNVSHFQRKTRMNRHSLVNPRNIRDTNTDHDETLEVLTKLGEYVSSSNSYDKERDIHSQRQDTKIKERNKPFTSKEVLESNHFSPDIGDFLQKSLNNLLDKNFGINDENVTPVNFENDAEDY